MDLKTFLLARIAEDEHEATIAKAEFAHGGYGSYGPTRVLAECAAKRAIVDAFDPEAPDLDPYVGRDVMQMMASVYADHPDYQEGWAA